MGALRYVVALLKKNLEGLAAYLYLDGVQFFLMEGNTDLSTQPQPLDQTGRSQLFSPRLRVVGLFTIGFVIIATVVLMLVYGQSWLSPDVAPTPAGSQLRVPSIGLVNSNLQKSNPQVYQTQAEIEGLYVELQAINQETQAIDIGVDL